MEKAFRGTTLVASGRTVPGGSTRIDFKWKDELPRQQDEPLDENGEEKDVEDGTENLLSQE